MQLLLRHGIERGRRASRGRSQRRRQSFLLLQHGRRVSVSQRGAELLLKDHLFDLRRRFGRRSRVFQFGKSGVLLQQHLLLLSPNSRLLRRQPVRGKMLQLLLRESRDGGGLVMRGGIMMIGGQRMHGGTGRR